MPFTHPASIRTAALARVTDNEKPAAVARDMGLSPTTVYSWLHAESPELVRQRTPCCRCASPSGLPVDVAAYAQLLGFYLGDGCLSRGRAAWVLRITCDDAWPGVAGEAGDALARVSGNRVQRARKSGCHDVQASWQHWPCLLPQHGPGKKHQRPIVLEQWQRQIVEEHPGRLLRGLFHSDGWRGDNVAVRTVGDRTERRYYSRYDFMNKSDDIRGICGDALDLLDIAWRPNGPWRISVARRDAVAALDEHVGPKY